MGLIGKVLKSMSSPNKPATTPPMQKKPAHIKPVAGNVAATRPPAWITVLKDELAGRTPELPAGLECWSSPTAPEGKGPLKVGDSLLTQLAVIGNQGGRHAVILTTLQYSDLHVMRLIDTLRSMQLNYAGTLQADASLIARANEGLRTRSAVSAQSTGRGAENNGPKQLFDDIVRKAIVSRASDIRLYLKEPSLRHPEGYGQVSFRIDGKYYRIGDRYHYRVLRDAVAAAYAECDPGSNNEPGFRETASANCTISVSSARNGPTDHRLRYQQTGMAGGTGVVARVLSLNKRLPDLEALTYEISQQQMWSRAVMRGEGGHFVAGVTGSGKTTTLYVVLDMEQRLVPGRNIVTIEDPVEYELDGIIQIPVQRKDAAQSGGEDPFLAAKRAAMRLDPDVLVPQEIRDVETGSLAKTSIQTGHKVYSTVHAESCIGIIPRLAAPEVGIPLDVLAYGNFLKLLVYQALLPRLCKHCRIPLNDPRIAFLDSSRAALLKLRPSNPNLLDHVYLANEKGCEHCHGGFYGVEVVAEMYEPDARFLEYVAAGDLSGAKTYWRSQRRTTFDDSDMTGKTVMEHAVYKMLTGRLCPTVIQSTWCSFEEYDFQLQEFDEL